MDIPDYKMIYKKGDWAIIMRPLFDVKTKKGIISIAVIPEDSIESLPYVIYPEFEQTIKQPGLIARFFGDTMDRYIQFHIDVAIKKVDQLIETKKREDALEAKETELINGYIQKIPSVGDDGIKRAKWRQIKKDK